MLLLEQFENLTLHPKNAARLKELVLQLAVQGKLTENWRRQNPAVEPAATLLKRIEAEKAQLVKEKKIKKEKPLDPISKFETPYTLPEGWAWCRLGETIKLLSGNAFESKDFNETGGVKCIKITNAGVGSIVETEDYLPTNFKEKYSQFLVFEGDLVVALTRPYIADGMKVSICPPSYHNSLLNQRVAVVRTNPEHLYNRYVYLFLRTSYVLNLYKREFEDRGLQPNLKNSHINLLYFPLPPLAEQEAIVARVEELMHKIEELEKQTAERIQLKQHLGTAALQQLTAATDEELEQNWLFLKQHFQTMFDEAANVKKLRETILQLAVQGKLTATWRTHNPTTEPASELLKRIQVEKAQLVKEKKIKKEKPLEPISEEEVPYTLPEGWIWCRLEDVGKLDRGKSKHRPRNDKRLFNGGKYPLVQTGDVSLSKYTDGLVITHRTEYNDFGLAQSKLWTKGTLCITIAANIAETGFLGYDACFPDSVVGFVSILEGSLTNYVKFFIDTSKTNLMKYAPSTAQKNINLGILNSMLFPLPPAEEQLAIVSQANQLMQLCDKLEQQIQQSKQEVETLMQVVVQDALQAQVEEVV